MPDRITDIVPLPRPVILAGRLYQVWPARVVDVAKLQDWLDTPYLQAIESAISRAADLEGGTAARVLFDAFEIPEAPLFNSTEGRKQLATVEGLLTFTAIALERGHPNLTEQQLARVVGAMTVNELGSLRRAFWGGPIYDELTYQLMGDWPSYTAGDTPWPVAIDEVAERLHLTYQQVGEMTLNEFRSARSSGKISVGGMTIHPRFTEAAAKHLEKQRREAYPERYGPPEDQTGTDPAWPNGPVDGGVV